MIECNRLDLGYYRYQEEFEKKAKASMGGKKLILLVWDTKSTE